MFQKLRPPYPQVSSRETRANWMITTDSNRNLLKKYFNVEFPPIYVREGQENVEVWSIYPPLQLHTGLFGPVNDVLKEIEKRVNISEFKNKHSLKGKGIGGDLQGPTIKGLIKDNSKLNELHDIVTKVDRNMALFVEYLKNLHKLNEIANFKLLDIDEAKCVLQILRTNYYMLLHEYDLSETLKMHIICAHYEDYFELTGETLLKVTDKVTESVHA